MATDPRVAAVLAVALALLTACGDGGVATAPDASSDAAPDGDAGADTALDAADQSGDMDRDDLVDGASDLRLDADVGGLGPTHLTHLDTPAVMALLQAEGGDVKYLLAVDGVEAPEPLTDECIFQNMRRFVWHIEFLHHFPELSGMDFITYTNLVLRRDTRVWWGGEVVPWPTTRHPVSDELGLYTYTIYADPSAGTLTIDDLVEVSERLRSCVPFAAELLVYLPEDIAQQTFVRRNRQDLLDAGVAAILPEELLPAGGFVPYSLGEGYGTLRVVPQDEALGDYGPRDVIVTRSAPNDIGIVAGLITADPQSIHSHVNLRLGEKDIPNAAVASIYDNAIVRSLDGLLVHIVVGETEYVLEAARLQDAEAFWAANRPDVGELTSDRSVTQLARLRNLTIDDASAYGAKAANLGELTRALPAEHRVDGLAIPFSRYDAFVAHNGLDERIDSMLSNTRLYTDLQFRRASLSDIRRRISIGSLDAAFTETLHERLTDVFGADVATRRLRFRSSTNAEDLDDLTGAGLYDSRSGCLGDDLDGDEVGPSACLSEANADYLQALLDERLAEYAAYPERDWLPDIIDDLRQDLTEERTVARALRRVWASLWNERAFDEREYYGLDHREAFMGVAVNPSFVMEQANIVAVTELAVDAGDPLYRLVSQVGYESVVRPADPTAIAEVQTFRRAGDPAMVADLSLQVFSNRVGAGERILEPQRVDELAHLLFVVQSHFEAEVYPDLVPLSLDLEIKIDAAGELVIKQVRPYVAGF